MNAAALTTRLRRLFTGGSPLRRQLAEGAAGSILLSLSSRGVMLLASILLARWLGAEGYGIYAAAMAVLLFLGVPTTLGLPNLIIRLLASYRVQKEWGLMRGLLRRVNLIVLLLAILLAGSGAVVVWTLGEWIEPVQAHTLLWALALLPLVTLGALRAAALRGLHHVVLGQLPESLVMPALFVTLLAIWSLAGSVLTPEIAVALRFAAVAVAFTVGTWLLLRRLPAQVRHATSRYDTANWARSAVPLLFLGGMVIINTQTDVLMLAAIQGSESAGVYQATARGAEMVALSLVVVNVTVQPVISRLYAAGEMERLQRVLTAAARGTLALALPAALILVLFGRPILGLVFGQEFERGALCLAILCGAQVVNAGAGSVGTILNMTGYERDAALGMGLGAFTNVGLNAALVPLWDIEGAALATGLSLLVWNVMLSVRVRQRLALDSTALGMTGLRG